jgi:CheY-like chemotaxis protein/PAS domain-containing protein
VSEFPPAPGEDKRWQGQDHLPADAALDAALFDAVSDAFAAAFIIYDRNDHMIFASRNVRQFMPLPGHFFEPGTRLRDLLSAAYDAGLRHGTGALGDDMVLNREDWVARQVAAHWKERYEIQSCDGAKRWTKFFKRRLSSGFGLCIMTDITEQKRREEQWRADVERVQLTEEILDNLAHPVFVQDRNLHLVAVNRVFCSAIGVGADNALGARISNLFDRDVADTLVGVSREVMDSGVTASVTLSMRLYGDPPRPIVVHVQRVGKPGRYLVVSSLGEVGNELSLPLDTDESSLAAPARSASRHNSLAAATEGRLAGRKALLVADDRDFETRAIEILQILGLDSCCVRSEEELEAFLNVARSVGVSIDLAIVDVALAMPCLEFIQAMDVDYVTIAEADISTDLAFTVLDRLTALQPPPVPSDDWEIVTEDMVAPPTVSAGSARHASAQPEKKPASSLVLVAEDNEINQIVFSQILEGLGYAYRLCADGETAVRLWNELRPAIVLMDVTLPGLTGFEAARRIRQSETDGVETTPIIGVLSQAFDRDREACFASGMNEVILKPLSPDVIDQVIRRLVPTIARLASAG